MTSPLAINHVLDHLPVLEGQPVELEGILARSRAGGYELLHYPTCEQRPMLIHDGSEYHPAVCMAFGRGSLQPNLAALRRWTGKRVRVHGVLRSTLPRPAFGAIDAYFDTFGGWLVDIEPYSLQRVSAVERRQHQA